MASSKPKIKWVGIQNYVKWIFKGISLLPYPIIAIVIQVSFTRHFIIIDHDRLDDEASNIIMQTRLK